MIPLYFTGILVMRLEKRKLRHHLLTPTMQLGLMTRLRKGLKPLHSEITLKKQSSEPIRVTITNSLRLSWECS